MKDFEKMYRIIMDEIDTPAIDAIKLADVQSTNRLIKKRHRSFIISLAVAFFLTFLLLGSTAYAIVRQRKIVLTDTGYYSKTSERTGASDDRPVYAEPIILKDVVDYPHEIIHDTKVVKDIKSAEETVPYKIIEPKITSMDLDEIYINVTGYDECLNYYVTLCYRSGDAYAEFGYFFFYKDDWEYETYMDGYIGDSWIYTNPFGTQFSVLEGKSFLNETSSLKAAAAFNNVLVTAEIHGVDKDTFIKILDTMDLAVYNEGGK